MPAGATAKDFQKALAAYAAKTGQTYTVDSAAFDPTNPARPRQSMALADIPPDVPATFTYLSVDDCRKKPEGKMDLSLNFPGKVVNHYQWCGWRDMWITWFTAHPTIPSVRIQAAQIRFRVTIIGWGSSQDSKLSTEIYVDKIRPIGGNSGLTTANTTLTFRPFCESIYNGGACNLTSPAPSATLAALQAGTVLYVSNTVTLPAASANNPDRITGFLSGFSFESTTTAFPGAVATAGTVKPIVRCDGATATGRGGFTTPACIYSGVQAAYTISRSDPEVGEVAEHIHWALTDPDTTTPLPGPTDHKTIPNRLRRLVDPDLSQLNRDVATGTCDSQLANPRPPGKSCDEYPFAASWEGAATSPDSDYSVALINEDHNSTEGGRRLAWYKVDRYLDGDEYTVVVT